MIRLMATECTFILKLQQSMNDIGRTICSTGLESSNTLTETDMKGCSSRGGETAKELTILPMELCMLESGLMERFRVRGFAPGLIRNNTRGNGSTIRSMGRGSTLGRMVDRTKECIETTRNMGKGLIFGRTAENMWGSGRMIRDTVEGSTMLEIIMVKRVFGRRIKD